VEDLTGDEDHHVGDDLPQVSGYGFLVGEGDGAVEGEVCSEESVYEGDHGLGAGFLDESFKDEVEELVGSVCHRGTLTCPACVRNPFAGRINAWEFYYFSLQCVYPAIFHKNEDRSYTIVYPDLPGCISEGKGLGNALYMAQSALAQWINYLIDKNQEIPSALSAQAIKTFNGDFMNFICAEVKDNRAVKRTVSIPKWMADKAVQSGVSGGYTGVFITVRCIGFVRIAVEERLISVALLPARIMTAFVLVMLTLTAPGLAISMGIPGMVYEPPSSTMVWFAQETGMCQ
jgi:predicted RNase H-like HicB family nuclease